VHASGTPTRAQTAEILQLLDQASVLNPDRNIDLLRAQAEVRAGDAATAERQLKQVVHDEPMNVDAWIVLGFATRQRDPALASLASAKERELAPPVPPAR
jgi:predicted Zn-dependent protease